MKSGKGLKTKFVAKKGWLNRCSSLDKFSIPESSNPDLNYKLKYNEMLLELKSLINDNLKEWDSETLNKKQKFT